MRRMKRALMALGTLVLLLVILASLGVWREHELDRCGLTPPRRSDTGGGYAIVTIRWHFTPPGWVCVYSDRHGRVVGEERP